MGGFAKFLLVLSIIVIVGILVFMLFLQEIAPGSTSRNVYCQQQRNDCYDNCQDKFIKTFCINDCDGIYEKCLNT